MTRLVGSVLLSALLVGGLVAHQGVLLVDVDTSDGPRIVVPVPVALARAGAAVAPDRVRRVRAPGADPYVSVASRIADELREVPRATLAAISDGDERVTVTREGGGLRIRATEGDDVRVESRLPLRSLEAVLSAYDGAADAFRTSRLVDALGTVPPGDLIRVVDGGDRVRIRRLF